MYVVSDLFKQYVSSPDRQFKIKAEVNGVTYYNNRIVECVFEDSISENSVFSIGSVIPSKITIKIKTQDTIAPNARIAPYLQIIGKSGESEWVPMGAYYVDKRYERRGVYEFTAYDKLICANQKFDSSLTYPVSMQEVLDEILLILGIEADDSVVINPNYDVHYKDEDITIREMLSYIASAHAACFKMSKVGKLKMVKPAASQAPVTIGRNIYTRLTPTNPVKTITKLRCIYNLEGEYLEIGEGTEATTLEFTNMYITEDILTDIYNQLNGFNYLPVSLEWRGNPAIESGDAVSIEEVSTLSWEDAFMTWQDANFRWDGLTTLTTVLFEHKSTFRGGLKTVSVSDSDTEQESEFPFEGQLTRTIQKMIQKDVPYYGVTIGRSKGLNIKSSDGLAEMTLNSDLMEFKAQGQQALFFDSLSGKFVFDGTIYARNLRIGGADGTISFDDLSDVPEDLVHLAELEEALSDYITGGQVSDLLSSYVTSTNLTTILGQDYVITGKILANQIYGGTLSGITLNLSTNAVIGDNLRLGSPSNNIEFDKASDGRLYLKRSGAYIQAYHTNGVWTNGHICIPTGQSIGQYNSGITSASYSEVLQFNLNNIKVAPGGNVMSLDMNNNDILNAGDIVANTVNLQGGTYQRIYRSGVNYIELNSTNIEMFKPVDMNGNNIVGAVGITAQTGNNLTLTGVNNFGIIINSQSYGTRLDGKIGFFGATPTTKTSVTDPSSITTGSAPSAWSQSWGSQVKTDLDNLRSKLLSLVDALQSYGLV